MRCKGTKKAKKRKVKREKERKMKNFGLFKHRDKENDAKSFTHPNIWQFFMDSFFSSFEGYMLFNEEPFSLS